MGILDAANKFLALTTPALEAAPEIAPTPEPEPAPVPKLVPAPIPEPESEEVVPVPVLDPLTRIARDNMKRLTLGRIGGPVFFDEMTPAQIRHWRRRHQLAMMEAPASSSWLGKRRLIWDREA